MKKIVILSVFCLVMFGSAFAQSRLAELDAVKSIKLLESTRDDVVKMLSNGIFPVSDASSHDEVFYTENAVITVFYSSGKCSEESEDWNIAEWKVTGISVSPKDFISIKDLNIDYSNFRKEKPRENYKKLFLYGDKKAGVSILAYGERVENVSFSPPAESFSLLCDKPEVKEYYSNKSLIRYPEMKNGSYHNYPLPNVVDLDLSGEEISACGATKINVTTTIVNFMNDVLTYDYYISGGKIVGQGAKVVWDLTGEKPGNYKITAVADNGCGPCGKYITKTITVKECAANSKE